MKKLLQIEWLKNFNYRPFRIFTIIYFVFLVGLLFIGLVDFEILGQKINLKEQGIYDFPGIWNFTTYIVGLLKIFLGCIIVFAISQEFSNRMFKQNVIDGLSRKEFIISKLLTILGFTILSTIIVFVITYILGQTYSISTDSKLVFQEMPYILLYFTKLLTFFCLLMFLSILLRKSMFTFLGLFMLWFAEGAIGIFEKMILTLGMNAGERVQFIQGENRLVSDFLPLESMSKLIESPLGRTSMATNFGINNYVYNFPIESFLACLVWCLIFIGSSYLILKKKDW